MRTAPRRLPLCVRPPLRVDPPARGHSSFKCMRTRSSASKPSFFEDSASICTLSSASRAAAAARDSANAAVASSLACSAAARRAARAACCCCSTAAAAASAAAAATAPSAWRSDRSATICQWRAWDVRGQAAARSAACHVLLVFCSPSQLEEATAAGRASLCCAAWPDHAPQLGWRLHVPAPPRAVRAALQGRRQLLWRQAWCLRRVRSGLTGLEWCLDTSGAMQACHISS
jgi:hypothetical protein